MKRIFYFTGQNFIAYHWKGNKCTGCYSFNLGQNGYEQFGRYLKNSENVPVRLLIDIAEEDFRKETIPHVYGADRKAVVSRLVERYYRNSGSYVYQEKTGRVEKGRRDDELLICALTNPRLLSPWLDRMEEHKVPLSGIWSLPLLSHKVLPMLQAINSSVLLVSQHASSALRQSYFKNGKLVFSRQALINTDAGVTVSDELTQTLNFLRAQHYLPSDEVIHVHVIAPEQFEEIESQLPGDVNIKCHFHMPGNLVGRLKAAGLSGNFSDGIFVWTCMMSSPLSGHYGGFDNFCRYYQQQTSKLMYAASIFIALISLVLAQGFTSRTAQNESDIIKFNAEAEAYALKYNADFESVESSLENSLLMKSTVNLVERLKANRRVSPAAFYSELSQALSQRGAGAIQISRIDWKLGPGDAVAKREDDRYGRNKDKSAKLNPVASKPLNHVVEVRGSIELNNDMARLSVERIDRFIDALKNSENIVSVEAVKLPLDVRSNRQFNSSASLPKESGHNAGRQRKGGFILKLVMQGANHAPG